MRHWSCEKPLMWLPHFLHSVTVFPSPAEFPTQNDRRATGRSASQTVEGYFEPCWFGSRLSWLMSFSGRPCCFASPPFGGFAFSSKQEYSIVRKSGVALCHTLQYPNKIIAPFTIPLVSYSRSWLCPVMPRTSNPVQRMILFLLYPLHMGV